jgi:hypothetical protein
MEPRTSSVVHPTDVSFGVDTLRVRFGLGLQYEKNPRRWQSRP